MSGLKTPSIQQVPPPKQCRETPGSKPLLEEYRSMRLLKCYFLNSHQSFPLFSAQNKNHQKSTRFPRRQTDKSTKQEMCFIPAFENGVSRISHSPQLTLFTPVSKPRNSKKKTHLSSNPRVSGCFRCELLVPVRVYHPLFPCWACDSSMYKTRACAGFGRAAANGSTNARRPQRELRPWKPWKSKSTKLCPLVGSGILYTDHPKDQPLCLVNWTS